MLASIAPIAGLAVAVLQHSSRAGSSRSSARQAKLVKLRVRVALRAASRISNYVLMAQDVAAAGPTAALMLSPQVQLLVVCTTALLAQHTYQAQHGRAAALQSPAAASSSRASSSRRGRSGRAAGRGMPGSSRANSSRASRALAAGDGALSTAPKHHELLLSLTGLSGLQQQLGGHPELPTALDQLHALTAVLEDPLEPVFEAQPAAEGSSGSSSEAYISFSASLKKHAWLAPLLPPLALTAGELLLLHPASDDLFADCCDAAAAALECQVTVWEWDASAAAAAAAAGAEHSPGQAADDATAAGSATAIAAATAEEPPAVSAALNTAAGASRAMQRLQLFQGLVVQQLAPVLFSKAAAAVDSEDAKEEQRVLADDLVASGRLMVLLVDETVPVGQARIEAEVAAWQSAVMDNSTIVEAAARGLAAELCEDDAADPDLQAEHIDDLDLVFSMCSFVLRTFSSYGALVACTTPVDAGTEQQTQQQQKQAALFCSCLKACNAYLLAATETEDFAPGIVFGDVCLAVMDIGGSSSSGSSSRDGSSDAGNSSDDISGSNNGGSDGSSSGGGSSGDSIGEPSTELLMLLGRAFTTAALALRQALVLQPQQPVATDEPGPLEITIEQLEWLQEAVSCVPLPQLLPAFVPVDMRQQLLEQQAALEELDGRQGEAAAAAAAAAERPAAEASSSAAQQESPLVSGQLADALQAFGAGLCSAAPVRWCCNNPGCSNLTQLSELQLVSGKSSVCGGCSRASYCSAACQKQHWTRQGHKPVCKAIQAQRQQQQQAADVQGK